VRGRVALVVAILLLVVVPLVPGALADGSPAPLAGLPVESILAVLLVGLLSWPPARGLVAAGFGATVVGALVLAAIDGGYRAARAGRSVRCEARKTSGVGGAGGRGAPRSPPAPPPAMSV